MAVDESEYTQAVSSDGVRLCVRSCGPRNAPAIVFFHGFSQSHLTWQRQFEGPLAHEFHLIAFDLRGHGWSDKPHDADAYRDAKRWADDVAAVLDTVGAGRAALVGWSYGGRVILDYTAAYGTAAIAGINFVAAVVGNGAEFYGSAIGTLRSTFDPDPQTCIDGLRRFLRACFARQPDADDFERMLAYNAMVPSDVRSKLGRKAPGRELLESLSPPALFTHGTADDIIAPAMSRYGAQAVPGARLSLYEGVGHAPFFEDAERFDRELAEFVRSCNARGTNRNP